ncbi:hypothetical protein BC829DRAFT_256721 [Chytridium lagenaria]|nr:hypothetical protein BC829DRAFT_256721 [Chytridium lagenaria]
MDISEIAYPMPNGLEEKTVAVKREREEEVEVEPVAKKVKSEDPAVEVEGLEIEEAEKTEEQQLAAKSRDYYIVNNSNAGNMITIKNLPIAFEAEKLKLIFGNKKRLVLDYYIEPDVQTNEPRGFVEFSKAEEATAAASRTGLRISGIPVEIRRCIPAKVKWENFDKEGENSKQRYLSVTWTKLWINRYCGKCLVRYLPHRFFSGTLIVLKVWED